MTLKLYSKSAQGVSSTWPQMCRTTFLCDPISHPKCEISPLVGFTSAGEAHACMQVHQQRAIEETLLPGSEPEPPNYPDLLKVEVEIVVLV